MGDISIFPGLSLCSRRGWGGKWGRGPTATPVAKCWRRGCNNLPQVWTASRAIRSRPTKNLSMSSYPPAASTVRNFLAPPECIRDGGVRCAAARAGLNCPAHPAGGSGPAVARTEERRKDEPPHRGCAAPPRDEAMRRLFALCRREKIIAKIRFSGPRGCGAGRGGRGAQPGRLGSGSVRGIGVECGLIRRAAGPRRQPYLCRVTNSECGAHNAANGEAGRVGGAGRGGAGSGSPLSSPAGLTRKGGAGCGGVDSPRFACKNAKTASAAAAAAVRACVRRRLSEPGSTT